MTLWNWLDILQLWRSRFLQPEQMRKLQDRKLRRIIRHAYRRVPLYRRLYDQAGVVPEDVQSLEDLARLPFVSKADLLEAPLTDCLARGVTPEACKIFSSSGTTGLPLTTYVRPTDKTVTNLGWFRAYTANGLRPTDRIAAFVGQRPSRRVPRWYECLGVLPRKEISAWLEPTEWVTALEVWRPHAITGYLMTLRILAEHVREQAAGRVRPRLLFHSSALLDDASRTLFSEVFRCRVVDLYGSDEAGCIAWECPTCGEYHVNSDLLILEVLRHGRPAESGETGEVVITNLHSFAMPLIRYRQEDMVRLSSRRPVCGRPFPLLASIEGRVEDFLVTRDGRRLPPHPFYHCIDPVPGIRRWRIVQERVGEILLELEPGPGFSTRRLQAVEENLKALTRGSIQITLRAMESLPVDPGRKFRTISSAVGKGHSQWPTNASRGVVQ